MAINYRLFWQAAFFCYLSLGKSSATSLSFSNFSSSTTTSQSSSQVAPAPTSTITNISYLRSPQCTASFLSYYSQHLTTDTLTIPPWPVTVSAGEVRTINDIDASNDNTTITGPATITFPAYDIYDVDGPYGGCCGQCSIIWENVEVRYFPVPGSNSACLSLIDPYYLTRTDTNDPGLYDTRPASNTGNIPIPYPTSSVAIAPRDNATLPVTSIGPDGFTYTSPYIYVVFQTIEAADSCGPLGGKYTSLTWSFEPGQLSTVEGRGGPSKSFNLVDLPCPRPSVSAADWYNYQTGMPYHPILAAPPQLFELDPLFKNCGVDIYEGYDPPFALQPQAALVATTDPSTSSTTVPAVPASNSLDPPPTQTSSPGNDGSGGAVTSAGPFHLRTQTSLAANPTTSLQQQNDPPSSLPNNQPSGGSRSAGSDPGDPGNGNPEKNPSQGSTGNSPTPNLPTITALPGAPSPTAFVVAGQTLTSTDGGFIIGSQTLSPGGPAVVVSGTTFTIASTAGSPGSLIVGTATFALPSDIPAPALGAFTAAGATFSPAPTGYIVGGGSIVLPGQAVTIDGTVISLASDDSDIVVGSATIPLAKTTEIGVGGVIYTGFVGQPPASTTLANGTIAPFFGAANSLKSESRWLAVAIGGLAALMSFT